jgi:hypothetical protein
VTIDTEGFEGAWCNGHCAVAFFKYFRPDLPEHECVNVVMAHCHQPYDSQFLAAPCPQAYEWWTPAGKTREQFLAECKFKHVIYHRVEDMEPVEVAPKPLNCFLQQVASTPAAPRAPELTSEVAHVRKKPKSLPKRKQSK